MHTRIKNNFIYKKMRGYDLIYQNITAYLHFLYIKKIELINFLNLTPFIVTTRKKKNNN